MKREKLREIIENAILAATTATTRDIFTERELTGLRAYADRPCAVYGVFKNEQGECCPLSEVGIDGPTMALPGYIAFLRVYDASMANVTGFSYGLVTIYD